MHVLVFYRLLNWKMHGETLKKKVRILFIRLLFCCIVGIVSYLWSLSTCVSLWICTTFPLWKLMYWLNWFALGSSPYGPDAPRPSRRALWSRCINLHCIQSISSGFPAKILFTYLTPMRAMCSVHHSPLYIIIHITKNPKAFPYMYF